ncbi:MAG: hypothetical protein H6Q67_2110 [Firmicutes bacterium]|nr:hypothetical protein [Bacillota bacterium]
MEIRLNVILGCYKEALADFELAISLDTNHAFPHTRNAPKCLWWSDEKAKQWKHIESVGRLTLRVI